jgi:hypothetical protein
MDFKMDFQGMDELLDTVNELKGDASKKIYMSGLKKAGKIIELEAKTRFTPVTKNPQKFLKYFNTSGDDSNMVVYTGTKKKGLGKLLHIFEAGTKERFYGVKGQRGGNLTKKNRVSGSATHKTGRIKAGNFWNSANEAKKEEAQQAVIQSIVTQLRRALKRLKGRVY